MEKIAIQISGLFSGFNYCIRFMFKISVILLFCYSIIQLSGCGRKYNTQLQQQDIVDIGRITNDALITVNRELIEEDNERIRLFVENKGWQMKKTESGLWYNIYHEGNGEKAETGKLVTLDYTISLPDSTVCYSSAQYGHMTFILGHGGVESGLEEGVLLLRTGDKAHFILPPHLAHGLTGDGYCIPQRAIIIYDVELVRLSQQ